MKLVVKSPFVMNGKSYTHGDEITGKADIALALVEYFHYVVKTAA